MLPIKKGIAVLFNGGLVSFTKRLYNYVYYRMKDIVSIIISLRYDSLILNSVDTKDQAVEVYNLADNSDLPTPIEQKNLNPLEQSEYSETHLEPTYTFSAPFVAIFSDVTTAGVNGLAYSQNGKIIADTVDFDPKNEIFTINRVQRCLSQDVINSPALITSLLLTGSPTGDPTHYTRAAILHGKSHTYYQWMVYQLLKLRGVEHYKETTGNEVHLIIPPDPPSYVIESLKLLGYDSDDYSEWDKRAAIIDELVIPSFPQPTPAAIEWLRDRILPAIEIADSNSGWIYISRQQTNKRRVTNFDALKPVLEENGIDIVELENHSLAKQIQLIQNAEGIIGPHGAGLTNMIWAEKLSVIEIFGDVVDAPFFILADVLGHEYTAFSGTQADSGEIDRDSDIVVDIEKIRQLLLDKA